MQREGLVGRINLASNMLTEELIKCFILTLSLSLTKREVGESSLKPFTNFGKDAVDKLFTEEDVNEILNLNERLAT